MNKYITKEYAEDDTLSRLSPDQVVFNLSKIPGWVLQGDYHIVRTLHFADFKQAMEFVYQVSEYAELAKHHPEIHIQYNQVTLKLTTHEAMGLTGRDFALAQRINQLKPPHERKR